MFYIIFVGTKLNKNDKQFSLHDINFAIAVALLCVKIIMKKNGRFSSQHIHDNPALRKNGIHCVMDQDREAQVKGKAY